MKLNFGSLEIQKWVMPMDVTQTVDDDLFLFSCLSPELWFIHLALSEKARRQSLKIEGFGVLIFLPSISHER